MEETQQSIIPTLSRAKVDEETEECIPRQTANLEPLRNY
jgi:hypothetical protein